jgi:hypothetical protein
MQVKYTISSAIVTVTYDISYNIYKNMQVKCTISSVIVTVTYDISYNIYKNLQVKLIPLYNSIQI